MSHAAECLCDRCVPPWDDDDGAAGFFAPVRCDRCGKDCGGVWLTSNSADSLWDTVCAACAPDARAEEHLLDLLRADLEARHGVPRRRWVEALAAVLDESDPVMPIVEYGP